MSYLEPTTETFEPFDDDTTVEVTYKEFFTRLTMSSRMPEGFVERVEEEEGYTDEDIDYLRWIVDEHTNKTLKGMLVENGGRKAAYVIGLVVSTVLDTDDLPPWEEFSEECSFMESGGLGIK